MSGAPAVLWGDAPVGSPLGGLGSVHLSGDRALTPWPLALAPIQATLSGTGQDRWLPTACNLVPLVEVTMPASCNDTRFPILEVEPPLRVLSAHLLLSPQSNPKINVNPAENRSQETASVHGLVSPGLWVSRQHTCLGLSTTGESRWHWSGTHSR